MRGWHKNRNRISKSESVSNVFRWASGDFYCNLWFVFAKHWALQDQTILHEMLLVKILSRHEHTVHMSLSRRRLQVLDQCICLVIDYPLLRWFPKHSTVLALNPWLLLYFYHNYCWRMFPIFCFYSEQEKEILICKRGKRPRGRPRKVVVCFPQDLYKYWKVFSTKMS